MTFAGPISRALMRAKRKEDKCGTAESERVGRSLNRHARQAGRGPLGGASSTGAPAVSPSSSTPPPRRPCARPSAARVLVVVLAAGTGSAGRERNARGRQIRVGKEREAKWRAARYVVE